MHTIYICVYRIPKRQTSAHVATYVPIYVRRFCTRPPAARLDPGLLRRRGKPFRRKFDFAPPPTPLTPTRKTHVCRFPAGTQKAATFYSIVYCALVFLRLRARPPHLEDSSFRAEFAHDKEFGPHSMAPYI